MSDCTHSKYLSLSSLSSSGLIILIQNLFHARLFPFKVSSFLWYLSKCSKPKYSCHQFRNVADQLIIQSNCLGARLEKVSILSYLQNNYWSFKQEILLINESFNLADWEYFEPKCEGKIFVTHQVWTDMQYIIPNKKMTKFQIMQL